MREVILTLETVRRLAPEIYELTFSGGAPVQPGQFVNLLLPNHFLRRPISVADSTDELMTLLVRTAGAGTRELVQAEPGSRFPALTDLGNGFDLDAAENRTPLLVGGGIGLAPLYGLSRAFLRRNVTPVVMLGFRTAAEVFYVNQFTELLHQEPLIATEDGTRGVKGFVTALVPPEEHCYIYACGPSAMLKAVWKLSPFPDGQYSLEARMGCGFGACMGCTIETASGPKRVCSDGPVFRKEELLW